MVMVGQAKRLEQPLRPSRRALLALTAATLAIVVGVVLYVSLSSDRYARSGSGCVNATIPSTMGGGPLHACGAAARRWCALEDSRHDELARLVQRECRRGGYARVSAAGTSPRGTTGGHGA